MKKLLLLMISLALLPAPALSRADSQPRAKAVRIVTCSRQVVPRLALPKELYRILTVCSGGVACGVGSFKNWQTVGVGTNPPFWVGPLNHVFSVAEQNSILLAAKTQAAKYQPQGLGLVYITFSTSQNSASTAAVTGTAHYAECGSGISTE